MQITVISLSHVVKNDPSESHSPPFPPCSYLEVTNDPFSAKTDSITMGQKDHPAKSKQGCCVETRTDPVLLNHHPAQWQPLANRNGSCRSNVAKPTPRIRGF